MLYCQKQVAMEYEHELLQPELRCRGLTGLGPIRMEQQALVKTF